MLARLFAGFSTAANAIAVDEKNGVNASISISLNDGRARVYGR